MPDRQYTSFFLGDSMFGIDITYVREINRHLEITPVALAPDFVRGLLNLRGQIITVLDVRSKLGLDRSDISKKSRCIVLKTYAELLEHTDDESLLQNTNKDFTGLLVDGTGDVYTVSEDEMEPSPANASGLDREFISGVYKLKDSLMTIVNLGKIINKA
ncbi:MAG: chemotaxis protein CheW [Fibrobacterota bacterium]